MWKALTAFGVVLALCGIAFGGPKEDFLAQSAKLAIAKQALEAARSDDPGYPVLYKAYDAEIHSMVKATVAIGRDVTILSTEMEKLASDEDTRGGWKEQAPGGWLAMAIAERSHRGRDTNVAMKYKVRSLAGLQEREEAVRSSLLVLWEIGRWGGLNQNEQMEMLKGIYKSGHPSSGVKGFDALRGHIGEPANRTALSLTTCMELADPVDCASRIVVDGKDGLPGKTLVNLLLEANAAGIVTDADATAALNSLIRKLNALPETPELLTIIQGIKNKKDALSLSQ